MKKLLLTALLIFSLIGNCYAANISNGDIDDEDMADITDWTNGSSGQGTATQVTFDSKSCLKLDTGTPAGDSAFIYQDIGTFGSRTVFSMNSYFVAIGTIADNDSAVFNAYYGDEGFHINFASNGLFTYNGTYNEVGTDLVVLDTWQEWTFDVDSTANTVDIYLNQVLQASDVAWAWTTAAFPNGTAYLRQSGVTTASRISYVDWFKAGSDFTPEAAAPVGQLWFLD